MPITGHPEAMNTRQRFTWAIVFNRYASLYLVLVGDRHGFLVPIYGSPFWFVCRIYVWWHFESGPEGNW
jgi:hypothetical protein